MRVGGDGLDLLQSDEDVLAWLGKAGVPAANITANTVPLSLLCDARELRENIRSLVEKRKAGRRGDPSVLNRFLIYAQSHPGIGYTCAMADLVNIGKGMDEDGMYQFMDADFANGVYNGYRFTLSGCEQKPARGFRITAEPVAGKGKAYCSDNTNNLRASDDGRGLTCLTSGKIARK